jgi:hypothetical protein
MLLSLRPLLSAVTVTAVATAASDAKSRRSRAAGCQRWLLSSVAQLWCVSHGEHNELASSLGLLVSLQAASLFQQSSTPSLSVKSVDKSLLGSAKKEMACRSSDMQCAVQNAAPWRQTYCLRAVQCTPQ